MRLCGSNDDERDEQNEKAEMAQREQENEEETKEEEEAEEEAADNSEGAASKFEHSMDDEEDSEEDDDSKKKKKKKDDKEDEEEKQKDKEGEQDKKDLDDEDDDLDPDRDKGKDKDKDKGKDKKQQDDTGDKSENDPSKYDPHSQPNTDNVHPSDPVKRNPFDEYDEGDEPGRQSGKPSTKPETGTPGGTDSAGAQGPEATAAEGVPEGAAAGAPAAEGTAAGAEGVAAGGTAAEGVAAGGAAAGAGAAVGGAAVALGIVILVILIIIILIGVAGFFLTMPQFIWNKLKKLALDIWDGVQGYVIGMDESLVNKDDIIGVAQYLYDMGYDLEGMGFADSVEIYGQKDKNGNEIPIEEGHVKNEIKKIDAPYLRAYLVAENRTYLINNYCFNLKDFTNSFFDGSVFGEGFETWGTGLIDLDSNLLEDIGMPLTAIRIGEFNVGELIKGVKVDRATNTLRVRRLNPELDFWNTHFDYTYFSLEGWTGRYGKPFELMLTLHTATMAPDLAKEIAFNKDLDAKVHVKMQKTDFSGKVYVDGVSIDDLEKNGTYDADTIKALRKLESKYASEIKTAIPYISSVTNHWFRNVYFEGNNSVEANGSIQIGVDEDEDGIEDYNEAEGIKTQKTRSLTADDDVYAFGEETTEEMIYQGDPIEGVTGTITFKGKMSKGVVQNKDAVRGVTNPTTKRLFSEKYYIYDGTIATAKKIQEARARHDNSLKQNISFTKDSLSAFTILESSETLDAQFIYRDLKELVIELGYFEREDFDVIEKKILEWTIPDYIPGEWPNRKIEKQVVEYGTVIACDETVAHSLGMSLEDLKKLTGTGEDNEEDRNDDSSDVLNGCLFIGDSYIDGLEAYGGIEGATFKGANGKGPRYWLNNINSLPDSASKICVYLGVNAPDDHESMKNLIDALSQKYKGAQIYVIEVMHLGKDYANVDKINAKIDTYNSQIREKCKITNNVTFISTSTGLVNGGYLTNTDSAGIHMQSGQYKTWAKNIANAIQDRRTVSNNDTDEQFVVKLLDATKEISEYVKQNNFSYGTSETIPPKTDGEKVISGDGMIAWALYKCGCTDQPENGLTVGDNGDFIEYCESKEWKRIDRLEDVQAGDIVFMGKLDSDGKKARSVCISAGEGKIYDFNSSSNLTGNQPINSNISDFMCAYRVTGGEAINAGFEEGLDVIAMGNGKVMEILEAGNNLYSASGLSTQIYGEDLTKTVEDEVEGREQTDEGIKIKLTDAALKGYTLVIYGFDVDSGITVGQEIKATDVIGKTLNSDMCIILKDTDKAIVEDVENYIKVPKKEKKKTGIYGDLEAINENSTDAEKIRATVSYFVDMGFTVEAACGILGNLIQESALDPSIVSSSGYHGLVQWDGSGRWPKVKEWMASNGYNEDSYAGQIRAIYEFEKNQMSEARWEELKSLTNIRQATELFCVFNERCVDGSDKPEWYTETGELYQGLEKRKKWAQNAYDIYMGDNSKGIKDQ